MSIFRLYPNLYVQFLGVPDLGFLDLSFLSGQWLKAEMSEVSELIGGEGGRARLGHERGELSADQIEKLKQAALRAEILKITRTLSGKTFEGVGARGYAFVINKERVVKFISEMYEIINGGAMPHEERLDLARNLEDIKDLQGEIWIGKKDFLPYKVTIRAVADSAGESEISGTFAISLLLKNYNNPMSIDAPASVKSLEDIFTELFGGVF